MPFESAHGTANQSAHAIAHWPTDLEALHSHGSTLGPTLEAAVWGSHLCGSHGPADAGAIVPAHEQAI